MNAFGNHFFPVPDSAEINTGRSFWAAIRATDSESRKVGESPISSAKEYFTDPFSNLSQVDFWITAIQVCGKQFFEESDSGIGTPVSQ
jgi:hypothetical protein